MTDWTGIGKLFERIMEHAPGTRLPSEEWPARFRYKCLACNDVGAEPYVHPFHPDRTCYRPCVHCDEGRRVLAAWMLPAKDKHDRPGVWHGMSREEIDVILARPCAHEPLPAGVNPIARVGTERGI